MSPSQRKMECMGEVRGSAANGLPVQIGYKPNQKILFTKMKMRN
jgi:hypothetical protein